MFIESCRIFVLDKGSIEKIIKESTVENLFVETCFYKYGAFIRASSDERSHVELFFSRLREKCGFFFLKNSSLPDHGISSGDLACDLLETGEITAVTAESCTGGLIAKTITDRSGSSAYFWGSFVTYDNSAKILLGVNEKTLEKYGAVSAETVSEMAECALVKSGADLSVAVSGIAGPDGGSADKPVGTVWFGYRDRENAFEYKFVFKGCRSDVREKASETAMLIIIKNILKDAGVDSIISGDYI